MTETIARQTPSFFPEKARVLSGSWLKLIAIVAMFIDHFGVVLVPQFAFGKQHVFTFWGVEYNGYAIFRMIGRLAFPIFCFLLVEGFLHTRNRVRYGGSLLLFAFISEIPWNLEHVGTWRHPESQNVFFTLFLGYLALCAIEYLKDRRGLQVLSLTLLLLASLVLKADYGTSGVGVIVAMYLLREQRPAQALVGVALESVYWLGSLSGFGYLLINLYNGERGFIRGPVGKYFFYIFYPAHIFVLYLIRAHYFGY